MTDDEARRVLRTLREMDGQTMEHLPPYPIEKHDAPVPAPSRLTLGMLAAVMLVGVGLAGWEIAGGVW